MDDKRRQRERQAEAGRWLRTERERAGFATLNQFARALGIDQSQVSRYELGTSAVSDDRAEKIAEVLRLDIITVRRNLGLWVPETPMGRAEMVMDQNERMVADLIERVRRLNERKRRAVEEVVRAFEDEQAPAREPDGGKH
ncbi:helix-turn-helix transcriptional regulator [Actinomadura sp. NPDC049382]|uniref:helix-turn-helix domain-containing protein n=1 Tax=Actinomadura sp. NPDC049382 TaxID=3158220 RepID=UPI00343A2933